MRILIADDHALVRSGLRLILTQIEPDAVLFEAADGRAAVETARREAPALCLLDISMPGMSGLDVLPLLQAAAPHCRLLMLSMHPEREYVLRALRAGAHGYLLKDSAVDELADAMKTIAQGRTYVSRAISESLLSDLVREGPGAMSGRPADAPLLTARQSAVLLMIAEGRSTRDIAERLHLSIKTIETHRAELMRRLEIYDIAGLTRYAIRNGIVSPLD